MSHTYTAPEVPESIDGDPLTDADKAVWLAAHERAYRTAHAQTEAEAFGPAADRRTGRVRAHGWDRGVFDFDQELGDEFDYGDDVEWSD